MLTAGTDINPAPGDVFSRVRLNSYIMPCQFRLAQSKGDLTILLEKNEGKKEISA